jgi:hypothetical protein
LLLLLWPYAVSLGAALACSLLLRRQLESRLAFLLSAFAGCLVAVEAIEYACAYFVPLDIAGTPPPDPRNAWLRFLITAAVPIPAALLVARVLALPFRVRGRSPNSPSDG